MSNSCWESKSEAGPHTGMRKMSRSLVASAFLLHICLLCLSSTRRVPPAERRSEEDDAVSGCRLLTARQVAIDNVESKEGQAWSTRDLTRALPLFCWSAPVKKHNTLAQAGSGMGRQDKWRET